MQDSRQVPLEELVREAVASILFFALLELEHSLDEGF